MQLGIVISVTEPETVFNALRLGNYALKQGDEVKVFLLGKGVELDQIEDPKFDVREQAEAMLASGGRILACAACLIRAFAEATRVLRPEGRLVVGIVPADSPWGQEYARRGAAGHPIYSTARFCTAPEVVRMAQAPGFCCEGARSCLRFAPGSPVTPDADTCEAMVPGAGFVALSFSLSTPGSTHRSTS